MAPFSLSSIIFFMSAACCAGSAPHPMGGCSEASHHPENGGYYIEGVAGVNNDDRSPVNGRRSDNSTWAPNTYYPHAEMKICTGMFCSQVAATVGTAQYIYAHTCGLLRFSYDAPSTVYEMADLDHFETCNFTGATLWGAANAGDPSFDYVIEMDHEKTYYYFASDPGCSTGQKVAVEVGDDYATNSAQCTSMGLGSSRIQNCDCNHQLRPTTLIEPCFTGFLTGCLSDMPDDLSCCNDATTYASGGYSNCGTCIPKSSEQQMQDTVIDTINFCDANATACQAYADLSSCPSSWGSDYDPKCNQWKSIQACRDVTGDALEACNCDLRWVVYHQMFTNGQLPGQSSSGSWAAGPGKLAALVLAVSIMQ
jgi:hypothetical protein